MVRELLQQRIAELGLVVRAESGESEEEAATRTLIEQEVPLPLADEAACQQYYNGNRQRFFSAPLLAARHILLACPADDAEARSLARNRRWACCGNCRQRRNASPNSRCSIRPVRPRSRAGRLGRSARARPCRSSSASCSVCRSASASSRWKAAMATTVFVDQRIEGDQLPYEIVAGTIRAELNQRVWQIGVSQYLQNLVGAANIEGIHLQGAETPLMQ